MVKYRIIDVKGPRGKGFDRHYPSGKIAHVAPFKRHLPPQLTKGDFKKLVEAEKARVIEKIQTEEKDWAHLSIEYPNLIGLTDEQVENFIKEDCDELYKETQWYPYVVMDFYNHPLIECILPVNINKENYNDFSDYIQKKYPNPQELKKLLHRKKLENYISKIKCYNKEDLEQISITAFNDLSNQIKNIKSPDPAPSLDYHTIYLTSPRGGLETLGTFAYANQLRKETIPFDLDKKLNYSSHEDMFYATSLPYGSIVEVRDIVYLDDICLSGEQQTKAYDTIQKNIESLKLDPKIKPRLHYVALVGSNKVIKDKEGRRVVIPEQETKREWNTVTIGELHDFEKDKKGIFNDVSAIVLPFSIPDGEPHFIARNLYKSIDKYRHL